MSWERFKVMLKEKGKAAYEFDAYRHDYAALGRAREVRDENWHVWVVDSKEGKVVLDPTVEESLCTPPAEA